jgi:hypothetical protein
MNLAGSVSPAEGASRLALGMARGGTSHFFEGHMQRSRSGVAEDLSCRWSLTAWQTPGDQRT